MNDAAHTFDYYAGLAVEQHGQTLEVPGESLSMVVREPVGVTVGITPWNFPILMAAWKLAPSLAAGNVMILKPASVSPLTSLELARIFAEVGLPEGVFQVVTGPGGEIGDYLVKSPLVDMVAFTGSVEVGKHIMREGAETVKKVGLELGGKSPNVVFEDADFEAAIDGVLIGIFAGTGEVCSAGSRAIVQRSIYDRFVGELVSRAMAIKVGPALDDDSEMGPLVSQAAARHGREVREDRSRTRAPSWPPAGIVSATRASTTSRPSSSTSTTRCASPRRRSSGRCWWSSRSTPRKRRSGSPTTRSTASPARCGRRTSRAPCA